MKKYFITAAFFMTAAFLFSCKQNSSQKENKVGGLNPVKAVVEKSISIELKGTLRTHRSYSNIQFMDDEKEIDAYLAKQEKSNPDIHPPMSKEDSIWVNRFEHLGLVKNYYFLVKNLNHKLKVVTVCKHLQMILFALNFTKTVLLLKCGLLVFLKVILLMLIPVRLRSKTLTMLFLI